LFLIDKGEIRRNMSKFVVGRLSIKKTILSFFIALLLFLPFIIVHAEQEKSTIQFNTSLETEATNIYKKGWTKRITNGFGKQSNIATRGMAVYNDELYIGTQNVKLTKLFNTINENFLHRISQILPNIIPKILHRTHMFKLIFKFVHYLRSITIRRILHMPVRASEGCEIWKYNYSTDSFLQIVGDNYYTNMKSGFNYSFNCVASVMKEFKGKLYVGTWSTPIGSLKDPHRKGGEIWRYDGNTWEQVIGHNAPYMKGGFGNVNNVAIWSMEVFDEHLYAGTMNWDFSYNGGCEIWRTADGSHWENVVLKGFKPNMTALDRFIGVINTYAWSMVEYQNQLYVGTFNGLYRLISDVGMGCQLWRTSDGKDWNKVNLPNGLTGQSKDGFGESENYGIRKMVVYNKELYVGTAANIVHNKGCEIWKFDGIQWTPIISASIPGIEKTDKRYSGFGNPLNKYVWSMVVTSDNKLWVGTANGKFINLLEPDTEGCEIWCYDGKKWIPMVKEGYNQIPSNGFGNIKNEGARSMIEYPIGSGNIIVGTFKLVSTRLLIPQEGCELWMFIS
jgi:hypothetical protein